MSELFVSGRSSCDFGLNSKAIYTLCSLQNQGVLSSPILSRSSQLDPIKLVCSRSEIRNTAHLLALLSVDLKVPLDLLTTHSGFQLARIFG